MNKLRKGFTLVELIVVIGVLAILAVGAVLAFRGVQDNARRASLRDDARRVITILNSINAEDVMRPFMHHPNMSVAADSGLVDGGADPAVGLAGAGGRSVYSPGGIDADELNLALRLQRADDTVGSIGARTLVITGIPTQGGTAFVHSITFDSGDRLNDALASIIFVPGAAGLPGVFETHDARIAAYPGIAPNSAEAADRPDAGAAPGGGDD